MALNSIFDAWRRRGLPTGRRALQCSQSSYSQFAEDLIAHTIFGNTYRTGRYLDIGCFDPQKWSNTYRFYQQGWQGVCIDPNDAFASLWKKHRPRDLFLNMAVSDEHGSRTYLKYEGIPQGNRLEESDLPSPGKHDAQSVPCDSLLNILNQHWEAGREMDLMSIDCEGHDLTILHSGDFERYRPRVLIVEDHAHLKHSPIDDFCEAAEYKLLGFSAKSKLYGDRRWMATRNPKTSGQAANT